MGNQYQFKHGQYLSPEYKAWAAMKARCLNPSDAAYAAYGGRGITVCDRWLDSSAFLEDMGKRPSPKHSLDRINNNGNYEPGNCRWATARQQIRNTRRNVNVEFNGKTQCLMDWSIETGIGFKTLQCRLLNYGWTPEEAFTTKSQKGKRPDRLRSDTLVTFGGQSLSRYEWAEKLGISVPAMMFRLANWPLEKALTSKRRNWTKNS
jgi:hypothetical protein